MGRTETESVSRDVTKSAAVWRNTVVHILKVFDGKGEQTAEEWKQVWRVHSEKHHFMEAEEKEVFTSKDLSVLQSFMEAQKETITGHFGKSHRVETS